jgi:hypothetical protein
LRIAANRIARENRFGPWLSGQSNSLQPVPRTLLTDLKVRALPARQQTDFRDSKLPSFGVRLGRAPSLSSRKFGTAASGWARIQLLPFTMHARRRWR